MSGEIHKVGSTVKIPEDLFVTLSTSGYVEEVKEIKNEKEKINNWNTKVKNTSSKK